MHNQDKYPEIWAAFQKAVAKKEKLMAKRKPFVDKMAANFAEIEKIQAKNEELAKKAYADVDELREVSREASRLANAMGDN